MWKGTVPCCILSLPQGMSEGITQTTRRGGPNKDFVWNFPIEANFRSTNPFGCGFLITF